MKSLVLFGDSLFGRLGKGYVGQLEEKADDLIVYNCATGGFNTRDGVRRARFISKMNPDYACLSFGVNDCYPSMGEIVELAEFSDNLESIIRAFSNSVVILFPCPPVYDSDDPVETQRVNELLARYSNEIEKLAEKTNAKLINSKGIYSSLRKTKVGYHLADGLHLNAKGYEVFIDALIGLIG